MGQTKTALSISAAAQRLGVSYDTVSRRIKSGELPAFRIGRMVRVDSADVERLLRPLAQELGQ